MINDFLSLEQARTQLAEAVLDRERAIPSFEPMNIHPWLAMSLMQKAIRRGREELALRASATLLKVSPDRFWRRICVTAYEDIGIADMDTVTVVTGSLLGKRWRAHLGGEWTVASYLVEKMAQTVKCRAADDLAVVCQWHSSLEQPRLAFPRLPVSALLNAHTENVSLRERALAYWYAIGTDRCRSSVLAEREGDASAAWASLSDRDIPANIIEVAHEGFRKTNSILCLFMATLSPNAGEAPQEVRPDELPEEEMIDGVPCWAFDVHVREGTQAITRFLRTECETTRWVVSHIPPHDRFRVLGSMLFRIESGKVDRRMRWNTGNELHRMADLETGGVEATAMREGLQLLRDDLTRLNHARSQVVETVAKNVQLSFPGTWP